MKHLFILFVLWATFGTHAFGADDVLMKAGKLLEKHRYEDAARELRTGIFSLPEERRAAASLTLGIIYLKNAELNGKLHEMSAEVHLNYLKRLAAGSGKKRSRLSDLYLGKALLEAGNYEQAERHFEKFIRDQATVGRQREIARVNLGLIAFLTGNKRKAHEIWNGVDLTDAEMKIELSSAYIKAGIRKKDASALCDSGLGALKKEGRPASIQLIGNAFLVYAADGGSEKGLDLLSRTDTRANTAQELIGKNKVISFYEVALLSNLSKLYLEAAFASLEKAAVDPQLRATANYYLGEAHSFAGNINASLKSTSLFLSQAQAPSIDRNKAIIRQAANGYQNGNRSDSREIWMKFVQKDNNPELLSEILLACSTLRIECRQIAETSVAAAEKGKGKAFSLLKTGIGEYYLSRGDGAEAVFYLEAGRDKGNKNKIDSNPPIMLVQLAKAYYRTKNYAEALEIYFEMSKQFPQVRQIQEALQGIYSMEHISTGDVKIN